MPMSGPTVVRRQLGRRLRRLRDAAGKTERDVEEASLASRAKLWRIETGKTPVKVADVRALCWLYGADAATTDALAGLAAGTSAQGWWEEHNGAVPDWFGLYVGLETTATEIRVYDPELVHGLFQTPDYARAVYRAGRSDDDEVAIDRQVKLRLGRQQILERDPPPKITAILGAAALARLIGGRQVMAEQFARLKELSQRANVDVRVLPWEVGAHAALLGAFTILDFDDPDDPAVVYVETQVGARYLEKPEELSEYRRIFKLISEQSTPIEEDTR